MIRNIGTCGYFMIDGNQPPFKSVPNFQNLEFSN